MKSKWMVFLSLVILCITVGGLALIGCETTTPTSSDQPQLRDKPYDSDGIRLNGTESCSKCGEVHQLYAVGYGETELHFCTREDAQRHLDRIKNGAQ